jgi:hypothetical protein
MYIVRQVPVIYYVYIYMYVCVCVYIYIHRVLVKGSVGVAYWSGVRPCTGQGLRKGSRTGQGSDRVLVRGPLGVSYWSGVALDVDIYTPCTGQGLRRGHVLVRGQTVYWSGAP